MRPSFGLRWKAWRKQNKRTIIGIAFALLAALLIFWLRSWAVYKWQANDEKIRQIEIEIQRIKDILEEEEKRKEEIREQASAYCGSQRRPQVCEALFDAGNTVGEAIDFEGLARFAVALGKSEQNYICPAFNCYGLGAYDRWHFNRYESYLDATLDLARLLRRFGYSSISPKDIPKVALFYKGVPPYSAWVALIRSVMEKLS